VKRPLNDLGFVTRSVMVGGTWRSSCTFTCRCGEALVLTEAAGRKINPEFIAKRARATGWQADGWRASVTRCPACLSKDRAGESPGEKVIRIMPETPKPAPAPPAAREPTPKQRLAIRAKLDATFDDDAGCYLDGASDQKIGEELNIPWSWVARIREAAYGPIRVDPEVAALRAEITGLREDQKKLDERIGAIAARVSNLEKKRGAA
jgi:hypothetical protein